MNKLKDKRTKEEILKLLDKAMQQEDQMGDRIKKLEADLSDCRKKMDDPRSELVERALPASKISFRIDYYRTAEKGPIKGIIEHLSSRQKKNFESENFEAVTEFMAKYLPKKKIKSVAPPLETTEKEVIPVPEAPLSPLIVATAATDPEVTTIVDTPQTVALPNMAEAWPNEEPLEVVLMETEVGVTNLTDMEAAKFSERIEPSVEVLMPNSSIEPEPNIIAAQPLFAEQPLFETEPALPAAAKRSIITIPEGVYKAKIHSALERSRRMIEEPMATTVAPKPIAEVAMETEMDFDEIDFKIPARIRQLLDGGSNIAQSSTTVIATPPLLLRGKTFDMTGNPGSEVIIPMDGMDEFKGQACMATLKFENMETRSTQTQKNRCTPSANRLAIPISPIIMLTQGAYRVTTVLQTLHTEPKVMYRESRLFVVG